MKYYNPKNHPINRAITNPLDLKFDVVLGICALILLSLTLV